MATDPQPKDTTPQQLEHILTSAVILNWSALTSSSATGRVRVDYHIAKDGSLEGLKLWAASREYWSLICDFSVHPGWSDGPRFSNGFHSRSLGRLLQSIVMNQGMFQHDCRPNSNGLLEIAAPTPEQLGDARLRLSEILQRSL